MLESGGTFDVSGASNRFEFANQLRGFAALCVVVNHFGGVYFEAPQTVARATGSIAYQGGVPAFAAITAQSWYNFGPFGVALFFLISGFVIPFSLERLDPRAFLVARAFRIFPTYMCGLLIGLGAVAFGAAQWHQSLHYSLATVAANLFLITDVAGAPSLDMINWTLMVELKFYVVMALLAVPLRRAVVVTSLGITLAIFGLGAVRLPLGYIHVHGVDELLAAFDTSALYVLYMLIGVAFNAHVRGRIGGVTAALCIGGLFAAFALYWPQTQFRDEFPAATLNYGWALILFTIVYIGRAHIPRPRVVGFFADISYPLYVIHPLVGWTVMTLLIVGKHVNAAVAAVSALAIVTALAWLLHRTVEQPTQVLGRALGGARFHRREGGSP